MSERWLVRVHRWLSEPPQHLTEAQVDVYAVTNYTMLMGATAHALFIAIFALLHVTVLALLNIVSVTAFITGLMVSKRGRVDEALFLGTAEVMAHAWIATAYLGWATAFHIYVLLAVVVSFLFTRIPLWARLLNTVVQIGAYVALAWYGATYPPWRPLTARWTENLQLANILTFTFILIGMLCYYSYAMQGARRQMREKNRRLKTALKQLQEAQDQIVAQQKLAHLGTLTAGIAHEIKNPLNFVNNFSLLSMEAVEEMRDAVNRFVKSRSDKDLDVIVETMEILEVNARKINEHGTRADRVVQSMLLHAGNSSGEKEPTDLNALVMQSVELARSGAHGNLRTYVEIVSNLDKNLPPVKLAPRDVARALLNIIGNAVHAAGERAQKEKGHAAKVEVTTRLDGKTAVVRVRDNGYGVSDDIKERIFSPFFTTRPTGQGTGLGLSISNDIVVGQHKGRLYLESTPGEFAEFVVELPVNGPPAEPTTFQLLDTGPLSARLT